MKLALIGCGPDGLALAAAARSINLDLAACVDTSLAAARKAATLARSTAKKDIASVLKHKDIEAVLLGGAPAPRNAHLRAALAHAKHVFCPAPFAPDATAAKSLLATARDASAHLYVAYDCRVAPEDLALARQLDAQAAGKPGFIRVHRAVRVPKTTASGGGKRGSNETIITGLLARDFDWLIRRFGVAGTVYAQATSQSGLDHAALTLTFPRGPIAQLIGTRAAHGLPDRATVEVCGTGGMLQYSSDDPVLESTAHAGHTERTSPIAPDLWARHLRQFVETIQQSPAKQQYEHELNVVRVIDAALRSADTGREQRP